MNEEENILEFGIKRENEERRDGGGAVIFDPETKKYAVYKTLDYGYLGLFGGGVEPGENTRDGVIREITEESGLFDFLHIEELGNFVAHYYHNRKKLNRVTHSTFFLFVLNSKNIVRTKHEDHENFYLTFVDLNELIFDLSSRNQEKNYDHWIHFLKKANKRLTDLGHNNVREEEN